MQSASHGSRGVASICEVAGCEGGVYMLRECLRSETHTERRKDLR